MKQILGDIFSKLFDDDVWISSDRAVLDGGAVSELLRYRLFDPQDEIFVNDSNHGILIEAPPVVGSSDIGAQMSAFIQTTLPSDYTFQVIAWTSPSIQKTLFEWAKPRYRGPDNVITEMVKWRLKKFESLAWGSPESLRSVPHEKTIFYSIFADGEPTLETRKVLNKCRREISRLNAPMPTKNVGPQRLLDFLSEVFYCVGVDGVEAQEYEDDRPLNNQLPGSGFSTSRNALNFGGDEQISAACGFVQRFPEQWSFELGHLLSGHPNNKHSRPMGPVLKCFSARVRPAVAAQTMVQKKLTLTERTLKGPHSKFAVGAQQKSEELRSLNVELEQGEKLLDCLYSVVAYAPGGEDGGKDALSEVISIFREANLSLRHDVGMQVPLFLGSLPFGMSKNYFNDFGKAMRTRILKGKAVASLFPVHGEWGGHGSVSGSLLVGRQGEVAFFDPYENEGNFNVAITGASGSGKSVAMQDLLASLITAGASAVVIDDGESFKPLAESLGGSWVGFDGSSRIGLNPFSLIDWELMSHQDEYRAEATEFMVRVFATMAGLTGANTTRVVEIEEGYLSQAFLQVCDKFGSNGEVRHVIDQLEVFAEKEPRLNDVVMQLKRFGPDGIFGARFQGKGTLTLDKGLTVFEMSHIKRTRELQEVVLQLIMFLSAELMMRTGRGHRNILMIDEAWDLLHSEQTGKFIEGYVRRARKYSGSLITGTQSPSDYYKNPASRVCFENSDWYVTLRLKPDAISTMVDKKIMELSPAEQLALKSLHQAPGQYSELAIKSPGGWAFGRLILDKYSLALYSTKGDVVAAINALMAQGLNRKQAIEEAIKRGVV